MSYVTLDALEAGPFAPNDRITFDINDDGSAYDLSRSYIDLIVRIESDGDIVPFEARVSTVLASPNDQSTAPNEMLFRDVELSTAKHGLLEVNRSTGILNTALAPFRHGEDHAEGKRYLDIFRQPNPTENTHLPAQSPLFDVVYEGTSASRYVDAPARMPLSNLLGLGGQKVWNIRETGATRINATLSTYMDTISVVYADPHPPTAGGPPAFGSVPIDNITFVAGTRTVVQTNSDLRGIYVGELITIRYTAGGAARTYDGTVSGIARNAAGTFNITFTGADFAGAQLGAATAVSIIRDNANQPTLTPALVGAQLSLYRLPGNPKMPKEIMYLTSQLEEISKAAGTSFFYMAQANPAAVAMILLMAPAASTVSAITDLPASYRFSVDGVGLNRLVTYNTATYRDRLVQGLARAGVRVTSMFPILPSPTYQGTRGLQMEGGAPIAIIAEPLSITAATKKMQLEITFSGATNTDRMLFYTFVSRVLKL